MFFNNFFAYFLGGEWMKILSVHNLLRMLICDIVASFMLGISIVVFAVNANFAPGGITGLSVITNYLFHLPIGAAMIIFNIPIILFTFQRLGRRFFLISLKSMVISALFLDHIVCYLPAYTGNRLVACVLASLTAGIGYSLFFNEGSSTGGMDFIIVALRQVKPHLSFGLLSLIFDGSIVLLSVFVFREFQAFLYGAIYTVLMSIFLDLTTFCLQSTKKKLSSAN